MTDFGLGQGHDIIFYVVTEDGQMRGFVLRQGILGCDIVGQAGKILCQDRVFLCCDSVRPEKFPIFGKRVKS